MYKNKLAIFVRAPIAGSTKTRLSPPLSAEAARDLYLAFVADLCARVRASRFLPTVFVAGEPTPELRAVLPPKWPIAPQAAGDLGARMLDAVTRLAKDPDHRVVIIGSDSPDLPVPLLKRAFQKLKHRDVVLGPATDGGYYLIGMRAPFPGVFDGVAFGTSSALADTVARVEHAGLSLALLPAWYDVDDGTSLRFLAALCEARRVAGAERLVHTERVLKRLSLSNG